MGARLDANESDVTEDDVCQCTALHVQTSKNLYHAKIEFVARCVTVIGMG